LNPASSILPTIGKLRRRSAQPIEISIRASGALSYIDRDLSTPKGLRDRVTLSELIKSKQSKKPNQPVRHFRAKDVKYEFVIQGCTCCKTETGQKGGTAAKPRVGLRCTG